MASSFPEFITYYFGCHYSHERDPTELALIYEDNNINPSPSNPFKFFIWFLNNKGANIFLEYCKMGGDSYMADIKNITINRLKLKM